jgi:hypothetical protein
MPYFMTTWVMPTTSPPPTTTTPKPKKKRKPCTTPAPVSVRPEPEKPPIEINIDVNQRVKNTATAGILPEKEEPEIAASPAAIPAGAPSIVVTYAPAPAMMANLPPPIEEEEGGPGGVPEVKAPEVEVPEVEVPEVKAPEVEVPPIR